MASGDALLVFDALDYEIGGAVSSVTSYPVLAGRNGHVVIAFGDATVREAWFTSILPRHYAGGGMTVRLYWMAATATTGNVRWQAAFERLAAAAQDIDATGFASFKLADFAAPGTSGQIAQSEIAFTNGAEIDSLAVGELFRLSVQRVGNSGLDTMVGNAQLLRVELRET
jgi:hypothetical protein